MKRSKEWWRRYHKKNRDRINANRRKRNAEKRLLPIPDFEILEEPKRMFVEDNIKIKSDKRDRIERFYSMKRKYLLRFSMTCFGILLLLAFINLFFLIDKYPKLADISLLFQWLFLTLQIISALIHNSISRKLTRMYIQDIEKINKLKRGENGEPRRKRSVHKW
jgi:hypothetical protein